MVLGKEYLAKRQGKLICHHHLGCCRIVGEEEDGEIPCKSRKKPRNALNTKLRLMPLLCANLDERRVIDTMLARAALLKITFPLADRQLGNAGISTTSIIL